MKWVMRFKKKGKLSPRYIGPFKVLERISLVAYRVVLPPTLSRVHNVFNVSVLRKYVPDPSHMISYVPDPLHMISYVPLNIRDALAYKEVPVQIMDQKIQELCTKDIPLMKVL
ncbi:uncharacterized protein LOC131148303 [Malania oleifera]|uniref:uncharacterized protein LOC131148303 n=1 Tax=Malania oleifera TaxID=397392 RepID=UPI0025AE5535|nr:uncharacterized protein LOC131148303 [Malania oleifera]